MSSLYRAWYTLLTLGVLTFLLTAFIGAVPYSVTSAVSLPHNMFFRSAANIRNAWFNMADRRHFRDELARLEDYVAQLELENRELELAVNSLAEIVRVREAQSPGVVMTAAVTGVDSSNIFERLTLNKGRLDGVLVDMPVTLPEGLVGIVIDASRRSSSVRALTDPQSSVGVTVRGQGGQGVAKGALGGRIRVVNFVESDPVSVGDLVETSSRGGLFPRGILVGEVEQILPTDPNSLRSEFLVKPAIELEKVLEVALIAPQ